MLNPSTPYRVWTGLLSTAGLFACWRLYRLLEGKPECFPTEEHLAVFGETTEQVRNRYARLIDKLTWHVLFLGLVLFCLLLSAAFNSP